MNIQEFLNSNRQRLWYRFRALREAPTPQVQMPQSPSEAMQLGFRMGLQQGYGKGLVDGVDLGVEVGALSSSQIHVEDPMLFS